jgi:sporulation integral membrane protein YlbJ
MHMVVRIALFCTLCMALFSPTVSVRATIDALALCAGVLVPAIVPTLLLYECLRGYGIIWRIAAWCAPMMHTLFRVPGEGAVVLLVGFASGYPVAAKLAHDFVQEGSCSRAEASRLICCATSADPLFVASVVATKLYGDAHIAPMLLFAHYGGALLYGLCTRPRQMSPARAPRPLPTNGLQMHVSVRSIASLLALITGLIVMTNVLLVLLAHTAPIHALAQWLHTHAPRLFAIAIPSMFALCEVSLGQMHLAAAHIPFAFPIASFALAWGGLAVHAQVLAIATHHIVSYRAFVCARLIHGLFAAALTALYTVLFPV